MLPFIKMHGAGNDFVVLDGRVTKPGLSPEAILRIAGAGWAVTS